MTDCLIANEYPLEKLTMHQLNQDVVGRVHKYLLETKKYSNRSYNKIIGFYTSFISWFNDEFDQSIKNTFEKVTRKPGSSKTPQAITKEEFENLITQINSKNGALKTNHGTIYLYRSWLADSFLLGLLTGRRREEIINFRFNQIVLNGNGDGYLKCPDIKVNRIQNRTDESEIKYIYVPLTNSLKELLKKLNYDKLKNTESFILAPELKSNRTKSMADTISRGFTHYYDKLNTGRKLTFKSLRKTYISALQSKMGNAKAITGHANDDVIEKHYLDKEVMALSAKDFEVFDEPKRAKEVEKIRDKNTQDKSKGIER